MYVFPFDSFFGDAEYLSDTFEDRDLKSTFKTFCKNNTDKIIFPYLNINPIISKSD